MKSLFNCGRVFPSAFSEVPKAKILGFQSGFGRRIAAFPQKCPDFLHAVPIVVNGKDGFHTITSLGEPGVASF
jgi:hypothetical protein